MRGGDPLAGHVGQLLVHELRRIGAALADEAGVEPLLGDALELAEQVELRLLAGVAPLRVEQALGEVEEQRRRPHVAQVLEVQVHALADDAGVPRDRTGRPGPGVSSRIGVVVELGRQPLLGQLDAIALDAREADFERVALGPHGLDLDRLARRLRRRDDRLGREVERNAEDVGVLDVEQALLVQVVGLAAQRAADDLLAEELRAEGADAEDVGDGVGVPALGEHRDRDDAADRLAEPARLADGVHDLAQQLLVGDVLGLRARRRCARRSRGGSARSRRRPWRGSCRRAPRRLRAARCRSAACSGAASGLPWSRRSCGRARGARSPAWSCRPRSSAGSRR